MNKRISPRQIRELGFSASGSGLRRRFRFGDTAYHVLHCGHPTAIRPWYGLHPDGRMILASNGYAFWHLRPALEAVAEIAGAV